MLPYLFKHQIIGQDQKRADQYIRYGNQLRLDRPVSVLSNSKYIQDIISSNLSIAKRFDQLVQDINVIAIEKKINTTPKDQLKKLMNQKDKYGYTPLLWCLDRRILDGLNVVQKGDYLSILHLFLHHPDCDVSILDNNHISIVHWAVIAKYVEACKAIFDRLMTTKEDKVKRLFNQKDRFGYAPLHYLILDASEACGPNHLAILKQFLSNAICDINVKDGENLPVLYWLMHYKQPKLIKELLASDKLETFIPIYL